MRIVYVARHGQAYTNDDEGAIAHALTQLGHEVICRPEGPIDEFVLCPDLILSHQWLPEPRPRRPWVYWYFDRVQDDPTDPLLRVRSERRTQLVNQLMEVADLGFLTDGDWAARRSDKLVHLPQGADERVLGPVIRDSASQDDLLFAGTHRSRRRLSFLQEMQRCYGGRFRHVYAGLHGRALADQVAGTKLVLAPDSPVSDRYCSNRVYLMLGFGACLLHPRTKVVEDEYTDGVHLLLYDNRDHLHELIREYLPRPDLRESIARAGQQRTAARCTYRQRCQRLLEVVKDRLDVC